MTSFQKQAIVAALKHLFDPQRHFSICDFDTLLRVAGVSIPRGEHDTFQLLHRVNYRDMQPGMRESLARQTLEILSRAPDVQIDFEAAFFPKPPAENLIELPSKNPIRKFLGI